MDLSLLIGLVLAVLVAFLKHRQAGQALQVVEAVIRGVERARGLLTDRDNKAVIRTISTVAGNLGAGRLLDEQVGRLGLKKGKK